MLRPRLLDFPRRTCLRMSLLENASRVCLSACVPSLWRIARYFKDHFSLDCAPRRIWRVSSRCGNPCHLATMIADLPPVPTTEQHYPAASTTSSKPPIAQYRPTDPQRYGTVCFCSYATLRRSEIPASVTAAHSDAFLLKRIPTNLV